MEEQLRVHVRPLTLMTLDVVTADECASKLAALDQENTGRTCKKKLLQASPPSLGVVPAQGSRKGSNDCSANGSIGLMHSTLTGGFVSERNSGVTGSWTKWTGRLVNVPLWR